MCSLTETRTWDPGNTVLRLFWLSYPSAFIQTTTPWLMNSSIPWHNHFLNNLGFEHTTTFWSPEEFFNTIFIQSFYFVYILALIVLEFHSLNTLSGDNWEIFHLSSWKVYTTSIILFYDPAKSGGYNVALVRPSVCPSVRPGILWTLLL
jgi:hypothetical protein